MLYVMELIFYQKRSGRVPVEEFIEKLHYKDRAKIAACLKSVEDLGFDSPRVQFRQIRGRLWEIKIKSYSGGYRIFYVSIGADNIVLLHAYKKQTKKAPLKEIDIAEKRMWEVTNNEKSNA